MKKTIIALLLAGGAIAALALTNVVITVPLAESKYTNMVAIASNQNQSVEQFLTESLIREIEGQRVSMLLGLWSSASPYQQERALEALRNP
jgi:hypothetical protein